MHFLGGDIQSTVVICAACAGQRRTATTRAMRKKGESNRTSSRTCSKRCYRGIRGNRGSSGYGNRSDQSSRGSKAPEARRGYNKTWWFAKAVNSELDLCGHLPQISSFLCSYTLLGVAVRVLVPQIYSNIFAAAEVTRTCAGSWTTAR
jgi:hypothetical protein